MRFTIPKGQKYVSPGTIAVEGDASSASYFLGGAAITGGPVTVRGCGRDSVQVEFWSNTVVVVLYHICVLCASGLAEEQNLLAASSALPASNFIYRDDMHVYTKKV